MQPGKALQSRSIQGYKEAEHNGTSCTPYKIAIY